MVMDSTKYRLTVSLPCYGRPARTLRAIECILSQDTNGWEAIIQGDGCPHFQKLIDNGYLEEASIAAKQHGNRIYYENWPRNSGGCGYRQTNKAIRTAKGKYIIFFANDDCILPNHFSHYLEIEKTQYDYMYFNSYLDPASEVRIPVIAPHRIGHSEIILTTRLAKRLRQHSQYYGHDWDFINQMSQKGKGIKSESLLTTYHVMHIPNIGTKDVID